MPSNKHPVQASRATFRRTRSKSSVFLFEDLPVEIQHMIISYLPISKPNNTTTTTTVTTQADILLLSRLQYFTFGPSFYTQKQLCITSILPFADTVLTNASPVFLHNIRQLCLTIDEQSLYGQAGASIASSKKLIAREVSRLTTLFKCYPELADGLEFVQLAYCPHPKNQDFYRIGASDSDISEREATFNLVESNNNECFTKFKEFLRAKVMKDAVERIGFLWVPHCWSCLKLRTFFWNAHRVSSA